MNNWYRASSLGYRNYRATEPPRAAELRRWNSVNSGYEADVGESEDIDQNYEDCQDYIEHLTRGSREGCQSFTLREKMEAINREIQMASVSYDTLVHGIAQQTLAQYVQSGSLQPSYSENLQAWYHNASRRASEFQRITLEDLNRAFLYLLPTFDATQKYMVGEGDTSMHTLIRKYAHKLITAMFTRSNITYAVIQYKPRQSRHQLLENLLGVMRSASQLTNRFLTEHWASFVPVPMKESRFVHSGGNMIVMIASMLCYLYEKRISGHSRTYGDSLLERIRKDFEQRLNLMRQDGAEWFYAELMERMKDPVFRQHLKANTENISDLDLLFMAPEHMVNHIGNDLLKPINELTAFVLRRILVTAHQTDASEQTTMARHLLPFAGSYDEHWSPFKFSNMSGIRPETGAHMRRLHHPKQTYSGYRQTSNLVPGVPMYLNRLKQGYRPFFELDLKDIPEDVQYEYSSKYGECLDCSIGVNTNPLYQHKQMNYMGQVYYSFDTLLFELNAILDGPPDDKTRKRELRRDFLQSIDSPPMNLLFQVMGEHIT